eukprot:PhF_6_TR19205/c0_g1_i1/m.28237/K19873/FKRP; fukutin-related protein
MKRAQLVFLVVLISTLGISFFSITVLKLTKGDARNGGGKNRSNGGGGIPEASSSSGTNKPPPPTSSSPHTNAPPTMKSQFAAITKEPSPNGNEINPEKNSPYLTTKLTWTAKSLYLPICDDAKQAFLAHNEKQRLRISTNPEIKHLWDSFDITHCLDEVPECEFWVEIGAKIMYQKCCVEHMKMKAALFHALDVLEGAGVEVFLDSGTLLSSIRDNNTLVPWETDIDLGIVGVDPEIVAKPMKQRKNVKHLYERCPVKVSKNVSRNGMCRDAHKVYYQKNDDLRSIDTSAVEIWPFWPEPGVLVHPTRKKLAVSPDLVLPMKRNCYMWNRLCTCPGNARGYLDHEYGPTWPRPKTIHWEKSNAPTCAVATKA